jgi:hypothetical protein
MAIKAIKLGGGLDRTIDRASFKNSVMPSGYFPCFCEI